MARSAIMISSIKFSPQFLLSLSLIFDDISYYAYHSHEYPNSVKFFLNKPEIIIEKDSIDPTVLKIVNALNQSAAVG